MNSVFNNYDNLIHEQSWEDLLFVRMVRWLREGKKLSNYNDVRLFNLHNKSNYSEFNVYTRLSHAMNVKAKNINSIIENL